MCYALEAHSYGCSYELFVCFRCIYCGIQPMLCALPNANDQALELFKTGLTLVANNNEGVPPKLKEYLEDVIYQARALVEGGRPSGKCRTESLELALDIKKSARCSSGLAALLSESKLDARKAESLLHLIGGRSA